MNGDTHKAEVTPGSPATKRKPVPTPRSTLRRPADKDEISRKQLIINSQQVWFWQLVSDFLDFHWRLTSCSFFVVFALQSHSSSNGSGSPENSVPHTNGKVGGEDGEDILAALEKIPGVGSLRSLNSIGSSQPSSSLEQRFKREESSHSLASGLSLNSVSAVVTSEPFTSRIKLKYERHFEFFYRVLTAVKGA